MRLIDADMLKDELSEDAVIGLALRTLVDSQPTAYDINKVVEELEDEKNISGLDLNYLDYTDGINEAIKIVKAGGKNE